MKFTFDFRQFFEKIWRRKKTSLAILIVLAIGGYFAFNTIFGGKTETRYTLSKVEKGTIVTTVTGSGQVSASDQVDVKPKVSSDVLKVYVKAGQEVKKGDLLVLLDSADAQKTVRDAEISLRSAEISYEQGQKTESTAAQDLLKTYDQAFSELTSCFSDFSTVMSGLKTVLFDETLSTGDWNLDVFLKTAEPENYQASGTNIYYTNYHKLKNLYEQNSNSYKASSRSSSPEVIQSLIQETYKTAKTMTDVVKSTTGLVEAYKKKLESQNITADSDIATYISNLNSYNSSINSHLSNLFSYNQTMENGGSADPLALETKKLTVEQKETALSEAKSDLADYYIRAPFDGIVASVDVEAGDSATSASSVATIITKQQTVVISLNEVEAIKVKVGQKATLTFDAIDDLTMTGQVAEVDTLGTVSQGVVSYDIKIVFDTQDDNVKTGMSTAVSIATNVRQDTLLVPVSAIKSAGNTSYVEVLENLSEEEQAEATSSGIIYKNVPIQKIVQTGISDDSYTEILSGLNEEDLIVSKTTIISSQKSSSSTAPSLFGENTRTTTKSTTNSSSGTKSTTTNTQGPPPGM